MRLAPVLSGTGGHCVAGLHQGGVARGRLFPLVAAASSQPRLPPPASFCPHGAHSVEDISPSRPAPSENQISATIKGESYPTLVLLEAAAESLEQGSVIDDSLLSVRMSQKESQGAICRR